MISVYIPTRGRPALVERAVLSVLSQTIEDLEVVVVIDGKDCETEEVLSAIARSDSRLVFLTYEISQGACYARNLAIRSAKGEFITGLDDDDFFEKEHLEKNLYFLLENDLEVVYAKQKIWNGIEYKESKSAVGMKLSLNDLLRGNLIGNQVFCRTALLKRVGCFDEKLPALQDYETWLRMLSEVNFAFCSGFSTYVVDTSHAHERITKSPEKVRAAVEYIHNKHISLFKDNADFLYGTLYRYKGVNLRAPEIKKFLSFRGLTVLCKVLVSRLKKINE